MSFKSPFPPVEISEDSIYETLFGSISEALAARGIEVGDKVALLSPNTSAFAFVFHGILRAGATATTVNALFTAPEIAKQLTDSGAKMLITITQLGDQ
uniref:AMP-binding protein n=1 Tax=Microbispora sp. NRRL B-24597 TaxID=1463823 RepID=UPI0012DD2E5C